MNLENHYCQSVKILNLMLIRCLQQVTKVYYFLYIEVAGIGQHDIMSEIEVYTIVIHVTIMFIML